MKREGVERSTPRTHHPSLITGFKVFIGHFAVGFAAKKVAPQISLGTLFLAALLLDCVWPFLVLVGVERVEIAPGDTAFTPLAFVHYPVSHSLLMAVVWGLLLAGLYWGVRRDGNGAIWIGLAVVSHWVLDALAHRADLPLYPGGARLIGVGLWNSIPGTVTVEGLMFVGSGNTRCGGSWSRCCWLTAPLSSDRRRRARRRSR